MCFQPFKLSIAQARSSIRLKNGQFERFLLNAACHSHRCIFEKHTRSSKTLHTGPVLSRLRRNLMTFFTAVSPRTSSRPFGFSGARLLLLLHLSAKTTSANICLESSDRLNEAREIVYTTRSGCTASVHRSACLGQSIADKTSLLGRDAHPCFRTSLHSYCSAATIAEHQQ